MKYDKVRKTPSQLLSLTGFTELEFEAFVPCFEYHRQEYYSLTTRLKVNSGSGFLIIERPARYLLQKINCYIYLALFEEQSVAGVSWSDLRYDTATVQQVGSSVIGEFT